MQRVSGQTLGARSDKQQTTLTTQRGQKTFTQSAEQKHVVRRDGEAALMSLWWVCRQAGKQQELFMRRD